MDKAYEPQQHTSFSIRSASGDDLPELRSFVVRMSGGEHLLDRHLSRPRRRSEFTRIATDGASIIGAALLGHVRMRLGPATIEAGVIDLFAVQEAWREQGVFPALLGDTLRQLLDNGLALALLRGETGMFQPFGFAPFQLETGTRGWQHVPPGSALRPIGEGDIEDLAALYEASYAQLPLSELRALPDWRAVVAAGQSIRALEDSRGRVVAYAALEDHVVAEAAAADAGAARALLGTLGDAALALPLAHPLARAAIQLGAVAHVAAANSGSAATAQLLAGVVDLPNMLEQLIPAFDQRLAPSRYAGWSGNLRIEIDTERVTLAFEQGRAQMIDGSRPADLRLRHVTLPALAQCCLGYRAISDLRATGELDCDDSALGLLDVLFPVV